MKTLIFPCNDYDFNPVAIVDPDNSRLVLNLSKHKTSIKEIFSSEIDTCHVIRLTIQSMFVLFYHGGVS